LPTLPDTVYYSTMPKNQSSTQPSNSPRRAAFDTLQRLSGSDLHADNLIDLELSRNQLQGPDRGLFAELVFGVLRRQGSLDHYLAQLVQQPIERLELPVLLLLRLGLYQLRYLDRVPSHAAVHETVELTNEILPRAKGLINGVLRNYLRVQETLTLPDPALQPAAWLSAAYSVPSWLAEQWLQQFPQNEAAGLAAASTEIPPLTLRTNTLKTTRADLLERFKVAGLSAEASRFSPEGISLLERCLVSSLPGFEEGLFAVQDESSQLVAHLLAPQPGEQVLDMCAAPGGKATHLAQLMNDQGTIIATDLNQRRIRRIRESAERLGLQSIQPLASDALSSDYLHEMLFDRVLLDAPCSGLGVIRRNPEAKWRLTPAELTRCAERQRLLLASAAKRLKSDGILVYATCSTAVEEDEAVVKDFLSCHSEFVVENGARLFPSWSGLFTPAGYFRCWPHQQKTDGFFAARLKRIDR
jgi:16S rRNA (cytosine967-C5)-methyltransferase